MSVLYLTEDEVRQVLTMDLALEAVEAAFRKLALDEAENVPRQRCQTDHVMLHVLPAAAKTLGAIGYKAYTTSKPGAQFHVTLFDAKTGGDDRDPRGRLPRPGPDRGGQRRGDEEPRPPRRRDGRAVRHRQAGPHAAAGGVQGAADQDGRTSTAATRTGGRRSPTQMTAETGVEVVPVAKPEEAAQGKDIVITATTSREPVLSASGSPRGST